MTRAIKAAVYGAYGVAAVYCAVCLYSDVHKYMHRHSAAAEIRRERGREATRARLERQYLGLCN